MRGSKESIDIYSCWSKSTDGSRGDSDSFRLTKLVDSDSLLVAVKLFTRFASFVCLCLKWRLFNVHLSRPLSEHWLFYGLRSTRHGVGTPSAIHTVIDGVCASNWVGSSNHKCSNRILTLHKLFSFFAVFVQRNNPFLCLTLHLLILEYRVKKLMLQYFIRFYSFFWVNLHHLTNEVHKPWVHRLVDFELKIEIALSVCCQYFVKFPSWKRRPFDCQYVCNNPQRKYIANGFLTIFISTIEDFGSHVAWGSTPNKYILLCISIRRQTKISNNDVVAAIAPKNQVFRLDVPVDDPFLMHLRQAVH